MIGAISGDVIGSVHEGRPAPPKTFPLFVAESRFTDDSVLTIATAIAIRTGTDYRDAYREWGRRYPDAGYGGMFVRWLLSADAKPYGSYGNGSAMRVAPIGWAFDEIEVVIEQARASASVTHDHPEGVRGAQAIAAAVLVGRTRRDKTAMRTVLAGRFGYDCSMRLDDLRRDSRFDVTCQGTVPAAAVAFFESIDFEDAIRNAVSLGGDTDTLACIAGALAETCYGGTPASIAREALGRLDTTLRAATLDFARAFGVPVAADA